MSNLDERISTNATDLENAWNAPALNGALGMLRLVDTPNYPLTVERENRLLLDLGFGEFDIENAFVENLPKAYGQNFTAAIKKYIESLDANLTKNVCVSFSGANGSGKTNAMATIAREVIRKKYEPELGRVRFYIHFTTAYDMIEDIVRNELTGDNIYQVSRFLLIDDLDRDHTPHRRAAFSHIISERVKQAGKPFVLTTAMNDQELASLYPHVFSRLKTGITLRTNGVDLRCLRK